MTLAATSVSQPLTLARINALAQLAPCYFRLRREHPKAPAQLIHRYLNEGSSDASFEQFVCRITTGHRFEHTGVAYGGDDESYHGEGRCYCVQCGADGDA